MGKDGERKGRGRGIKGIQMGPAQVPTPHYELNHYIWHIRTKKKTKENSSKALAGLSGLKWLGMGVTHFSHAHTERRSSPKATSMMLLWEDPPLAEWPRQALGL